jgi:hypothetical protein
VQDKRLKKTISDFRNNKAGFTTWTQTTIDEERWKYLSENPGAEGFIFLKNSGKMPKMTDKVNVVIDEWVCVLNTTVFIDSTKFLVLCFCCCPSQARIVQRGGHGLG